MDKLKDLLNNKTPHICCVSETWFDRSIDTPKYKGYTKIYRKDRIGGDGGGIITFVRHDIKTSEIHLHIHQDSIIEAQVIEITLTQGKIKLLHIYNPEPSLNIDHLSQLINQLGRKYLVVGDMNGHHTLWDPYIQSNNQCGNILSEYILDQPTIALATEPGLATHTNNRGITSTLDLTLCSSNLIHITSTKALADHGSDHFPVLTKLYLAPEKVTKEKRPKWIITEDKWNIFQENIEEQTEVYEHSEDLNKAFTKSIKKAASKTFKKNSSQKQD